MGKRLAAVLWRAGLLMGLAALAACGGGAAVETAKDQPDTVAAKADVSTFKGHGSWWNPAESGSGFFFEAQGSTGVVTFYSYETNGRPVWYLASGPFTGSADGKFQFSGTLLRYSGGQPASSAVPKTPTSTPVGTVTITFTGETAQVRVPGRTYGVEKFNRTGRFKPASAIAPQTGAFWNPDQSGRGYVIEVADDVITAAVFHYADDGQPIWNLVAAPLPAAGQLARGSFVAFSGGQTLGGAYKTPSANNLGEFTLKFPGPCSGEVAFPGMQAMAVSRFAFGTTSACRTDARQGPTYMTVLADAVEGSSQAGGTAAQRPIGVIQQHQRAADEGARFVGVIPFGSEYSYVYVKEGGGPYEQQLLSQAGLTASVQVIREQLAELGARGFRYTGGPVSRKDGDNMVMVKDLSGRTYQYEVLQAPRLDQSSSARFASQASQMGAVGFNHVLHYRSGALAVNIYMRQSGSDARYQTQAVPFPYNSQASSEQNKDRMLSHLNSMGEQGWRFRAQPYVAGEGPVSIFVKDFNQPQARFTYKLSQFKGPADAAAYLNAETADGFVLAESTAGTPMAGYHLFAKPESCTGLICEANSGDRQYIR